MPDGSVKLEIRIFPDRIGRLTLDGHEYTLTGWRRDEDGVIRAEVVSAPDPAWEAYLAGIYGKVDG